VEPRTLEVEWALIYSTLSTFKAGKPELQRLEFDPAGWSCLVAQLALTGPFPTDI